MSVDSVIWGLLVHGILDIHTSREHPALEIEDLS